MKILLTILFAISLSWAVSKPMESLENYNVLLLHGAYGSEKGFLNVDDTDRTVEAYYATKPLDKGAALGRYYEKKR